MIRATLNEPVPLQLQVGNGQDDLFVRAKIYDKEGELLAEVSLNHMDNGLYGSVYTFITTGHYAVVYQLFLDEAYEISSEFDIEAEVFEANEDKTNLLRMVGLAHDNTVIDNNTYNGQGNLLTSRVRQYSSKEYAQATDAAGLMDTWSITAIYTDGKLEKYTMVRE